MKPSCIQAILNFSAPLDVGLLDRVAQVFLAGSGAEVGQLLYPQIVVSI